MSKRAKAGHYQYSALESKSKPNETISADALPDLSQDAKTWPTLQAILHPQTIHIEIDPDLLCPITHALIRDPVTTVDGQMYEREAIEEWLSKRNTSPLTNEPLSSKQLTPSLLAKRQIGALVDKHPALKDSEEWYFPQGWIAALETACKAGDEKQIRELVSRDRRLLVHPFKGCYAGQTALNFAIRHPKALDVVIELLETRQQGLALAALLRPDHENLLPIHRAILAQQDAQTLLKLMRRMGHQIAVVQPWSDNRLQAIDRRSLNDALRECVAQEDLEKITWLLRLGADLQAKNAAGETLVYQAVKEGCPHSLAKLLEAKASPDLNDSRLDDAPLHAAVRHGDQRIITALLQAGAVDRALNNGRTALHLAAERNADGLLEILAEGKDLPPARREAKDAAGYTPLHRAAAAGAVATLTWLLDHGADGRTVNAEGETALHLAARANQPETLALLLKRGRSLGAIDHAGNTALHAAAESGAREAIIILLKAGIAANLKNKAGYTARQLAENTHDMETVKQHDQTVMQIQAAEEKALQGEGILGLFLLKQQQIIQNQQGQIEALQLENKSLRQEIHNLNLRNQEIKALSNWRADLFTVPLERQLIGLRQQEDDHLRLELVTACEHGDIKAVQAAIEKGAKPFYPDLGEKQKSLKVKVKQPILLSFLMGGERNAEPTQKQPLAAAIWGMNPEVVNVLLQQMGGVSPMTWEECEAHNMKHYKEVFIITKFKPKTYWEWHRLLLKIEPCPFICAYHLKKVKAYQGGYVGPSYSNSNYGNASQLSWENLKQYVAEKSGSGEYQSVLQFVSGTENGLMNYRVQIRHGITSAKRPAAGKSF